MKVLSHKGGRRAAGPASRVTHFLMNDIHLPSFHREDYVGNSSLSETVREHIYINSCYSINYVLFLKITHLQTKDSRLIVEQAKTKASGLRA